MGFPFPFNSVSVGVRVVASLSLLAICVAASPAAAAPDLREVPVKERERVGKLADEGFALFEQGDYAAALARFEEAETALPIPTITLQRALTLEKLGRLAEAYKACERVARTEPDKEAPFQHLEAKKKAEVELARLDARVPTLRISIRGGEGARQLEMDGRPIGFTGDPIRVDPGRHVLRGRDPRGATAEAVVDVAEGAREEVLLVFGATPGDRAARNVWLAVGYGAIGLSAAALGVAIGTAVAAADVASEIDAQCPAGGCASVGAREDERDLFTAVAISAGISGAVVSALGVTAVVVGGRDPAGTTARLSVGPLAIGLELAF